MPRTEYGNYIDKPTLVYSPTEWAMSLNEAPICIGKGITRYRRHKGKLIKLHNNATLMDIYYKHSTIEYKFSDNMFHYMVENTAST